MIKIGITQRVIENLTYSERRDALDQRWIPLLELCGIIGVPIPNHVSDIANYSQELGLCGFILSGGNDLVAYNGDAPERDALEKNILSYCIGHELPVLGICRGMQLMNIYFGGTLKRVEGHVAKQMDIIYHDKPTQVNSYHNLALDLVSKDFNITGIYLPGKVIKAFEHKHYPITGIMWHPERYEIYKESDIQLIKKHFIK